MTQPVQRQASCQDPFDLAAHLADESIDGVPHTHPTPSPRHAWVSSRLGGKLAASDGCGKGDRGRRWISDEPALPFETDIRVPDSAGWRRERMPVPPTSAWFETVPERTCEVLSPSKLREDLAQKMPKLACLGVSWSWLFDPENRILEAHELREGLWSLIVALTDNHTVGVRPCSMPVNSS